MSRLARNSKFAAGRAAVCISIKPVSLSTVLAARARSVALAASVLLVSMKIDDWVAPRAVINNSPIVPPVSATILPLTRTSWPLTSSKWRPAVNVPFKLRVLDDSSISVSEVIEDGSKLVRFLPGTPNVKTPPARYSIHSGASKKRYSDTSLPAMKMTPRSLSSVLGVSVVVL